MPLRTETSTLRKALLYKSAFLRVEISVLRGIHSLFSEHSLRDVQKCFSKSRGRSSQSTHELFSTKHSCARSISLKVEVSLLRGTHSLFSEHSLTHSLPHSLTHPLTHSSQSTHSEMLKSAFVRVEVSLPRGPHSEIDRAHFSVAVCVIVCVAVCVAVCTHL